MKQCSGLKHRWKNVQLAIETQTCLGSAIENLKVQVVQMSMVSTWDKAFLQIQGGRIFI